MGEVDRAGAEVSDGAGSVASSGTSTSRVSCTSTTTCTCGNVTRAPTRSWLAKKRVLVRAARRDALGRLEPVDELAAHAIARGERDVILPGRFLGERRERSPRDRDCQHRQERRPHRITPVCARWLLGVVRGAIVRRGGSADGEGRLRALEAVGSARRLLRQGSARRGAELAPGSRRDRRARERRRRRGRGGRCVARRPDGIRPRRRSSRSGCTRRMRCAARCSARSAARSARVAAYLVVEIDSAAQYHPQLVPAGERTPGFNLVTCIEPKDGLRYDEFHPPLARRSPRGRARDAEHVRLPVRNEIVRALTPDAPKWAAVVEESFPIEALTDPAIWYAAQGSPDKLGTAPPPHDGELHRVPRARPRRITPDERVRFSRRA